MLDNDDFEATLEKFIAFKEDDVSDQPEGRRRMDFTININTIANIITAIMAVLIVFKLY